MKKVFYLIVVLFLFSISACSRTSENSDVSEEVKGHILSITNQCPVDFKSVVIKMQETENKVDSQFANDIRAGDDAKFNISEDYGDYLEVTLNPKEGFSITQEIKVDYNEGAINEYSIVLQNNEIVIINES